MARRPSREQRKRNCRNREASDRAAIPAPVRTFHKTESERGDRSHQKEAAEDVRKVPSLLLVTHLRNRLRDANECEEAERKIDQEDPTPAHLYEQASKRRARLRADARER